jgi:hypothetical protein
MWSRTIVDHSQMTTADLAVNATGSVYVAGSFDGTTDFDPGPKTKYVSSGAERAGFVLKLDTSGNFGWVSPFLGKRIGSTNGSSAATSVTLDGSNNVIVGGSFIGTVDFNPGSGTSYVSTTSGGFVMKLTSTGALVWAKALQGNATTFVRGLDADAAGNIYATGSFHGTVDLDPGTGAHSRSTAGQGDIFVMKLTSAGNFVWAETFGGVGNDVSFGIVVNTDGDVQLAGYYRDPFDVDPDPWATYMLPGDGSFNRGLLLRLRQA